MNLLTENIRNVSLSNGLVRVETVATGADGQETKTGEIVIPATQYGAVVEALRRSGEQLQQRVQGQPNEGENA